MEVYRLPHFFFRCFRFRLVLSTSLTKSSSVAKISHNLELYFFMYYISLKQQAKIISPNSSPSSTDLANNKKKLVSNQSGFHSNYFWSLKKLVSNRSWLLSNYFWPLKKLVSGPCIALLDLYFFIIKSNKQAPGSFAVSLFFLFEKATSNKQQASPRQQQSPITLDNYYRIL